MHPLFAFCLVVLPSVVIGDYSSSNVSFTESGSTVCGSAKEEPLKNRRRILSHTFGAYTNITMRSIQYHNSVFTWAAKQIRLCEKNCSWIFKIFTRKIDLQNLTKTAYCLCQPKHKFVSVLFFLFAKFYWRYPRTSFFVDLVRLQKRIRWTNWCSPWCPWLKTASHGVRQVLGEPTIFFQN